jgi:hypothetical protein
MDSNGAPVGMGGIETVVEEFLTTELAHPQIHAAIRMVPRTPAISQSMTFGPLEMVGSLFILTNQ